MAKQAQPRRRWHRFRVIFRRCRITVLLVILALTIGLVYVNSVGLPGFIKKPLLEKLHARGLDLQFTRLRWRPVQGIVAENVFFGRTNDIASPELTLKEVQVRIDYAAFLHRQFQVKSLLLHQGRLAWPVGTTNGPPRQLLVENIQTDLQLLTNDVWQLDNLQAQFGGVKIQLTGSVTNASVVRDWKIFHGAKPAPGTLHNRLSHLADILEQIHFATSAPELNLDVRGDARDVENMAVRMSIAAPDADTPWGAAQGIKCSMLFAPPRTNRLFRAEINLRAANAITRWAATTDLELSLEVFSEESDTNLVRVEMDLAAGSAQSRSNHVEQLLVTAQWFHSLTNAIPLSGRGEVQANNAFTEWGSAKKIHFTGALLTSTNTASPDASWAWWAKLAPYPLQIAGEASGVHSPKLDADQILCSGRWSAPELSLEKLSAKIFGGNLEAKAKLNVATRAVTFSVATDFDGQKAAPLLTPKAQEWLANYSWNNPPQIKAEGALVLPVSIWTNRQPDWRGEVQPTLRLDGHFQVVDAAFRGVRALTAESHFSYSNLCWRLPDLVAMRPEGGVALAIESNDRTKDFYFRLHSAIDPRAVRPLLETNQQRAFDLFTIEQPPVVDGEIWGRWHAPERIGARARVTATNFTVRGESGDWVRTEALYTNRILTLIEPRAQRAATQELAAAGLTFVFDDRKIFVTNGFSTADPGPVVHAIGPHVEHAVEPYHFLRPPTVHVSGTIPMHTDTDADLHFVVDGGPFEWWKFEVPHVSGKVDWVGQRLTLTDVQADFYQGKASGNARFDFEKNTHGAKYQFDMVATDADLHLLTRDLSGGKTNKLEGLVTGRLEITNAITSDWQSWQGAGRVDLRNGLIWDIPIFGVFSPVLDTVMPGLGSSRARQGSATFVITNGVIDSEDLKIETLMARLRYRGTIDLKGTVDARMEAELFRNAWVVGPVLSLALWPVSKTFEYSITGTIQQPKSAPLFVPRIFFLPLHPVQTIKDMMPESNGTSTNTAPVFEPLPEP